MSAKSVNFYRGIETEDRVTIFVPPGDFDVTPIRSTYGADLFTTDQALIIKVKSPEGQYIATNPSLREAIVGGKEVWVTHLHPQLGYLLDQCKLEFEQLD
jgi:hypothetical protein